MSGKHSLYEFFQPELNHLHVAIVGNLEVFHTPRAEFAELKNFRFLLMLGFSRAFFVQAHDFFSFRLVILMIHHHHKLRRNPSAITAGKILGSHI